MPKYCGGELGMAVEAQAADHQPVEMPEQEIGEVERAGLVVGQSSANASLPAKNS